MRWNSETSFLLQSPWQLVSVVSTSRTIDLFGAEVHEDGLGVWLVLTLPREVS